MGCHPRRSAQRRPGPRPRRHYRFEDAGVVEARSTKAGAETPAIQRNVADHLGVQTRSTKAGAETPATLGLTNRSPDAGFPLNEGRGRDPGDTLANRCETFHLHRSTKAGAETPATHPEVLIYMTDLERSTKAGAETPATRQGSLGLTSAPDRSTKAGAETPATHGIEVRWTALNEGRGRDPGDTTTTHERGDHRSTKAGAETPATR